MVYSSTNIPVHAEPFAPMSPVAPLEDLDERKAAVRHHIDGWYNAYGGQGAFYARMAAEAGERLLRQLDIYGGLRDEVVRAVILGYEMRRDGYAEFADEQDESTRRLVGREREHWQRCEQERMVYNLVAAQAVLLCAAQARVPEPLPTAGDVAVAVAQAMGVAGVEPTPTPTPTPAPTPESSEVFGPTVEAPAPGKDG